MNLIYRKIQPTWIIHQQTHTFSHIIKRPMTLLQKIYIYRFFFFLRQYWQVRANISGLQKLSTISLSQVCVDNFWFLKDETKEHCPVVELFFVVVSSSLQLFLSQPLSLSHYVNNRKHGGMADTNSYCPWIQTDTGFSRHIPHFVLENQWRISLAMEAYSTTSSSLSVSLTILQNTVFFIVKTIHSVHIHICVLSGEGPLDLKKKKFFHPAKWFIPVLHIYIYCTFGEVYLLCSKGYIYRYWYVYSNTDL